MVTLKTFEQIIPRKLWANFTTTLSLYYLDVYGSTLFCFFLSQMLRTKSLSLAIIYSLIQCQVWKGEPLGALEMCSTRVVSSLNCKLQSQGLSRTKGLASTVKHKVLWYWHQGQCYKTFYHGNLLPFHGKTIILCYKSYITLVITMEWQ